jgi:hemerythrin
MVFTGEGGEAMALIVWNESLQLGHDAIDKQHKKLVGIVNDVHDSMLAGKSKTVLGGALSDLIAYTQSHFRYEEQLFRRYNYPLIAEHVAEHTNLAKRVLDYKARYDCGRTMLCVELLQFLTNWLSTHILGSDREFVKYLSGRNVRV